MKEMASATLYTKIHRMILNQVSNTEARESETISTLIKPPVGDVDWLFISFWAMRIIRYDRLPTYLGR